MLNQSYKQQFYEYLIEKTFKSFDNNLSSGERYYIQFEDKEDVKNFYNSICENEDANDFVYIHEHDGRSYEPYRTKSINLNGKKLIIAAAVDGITPNYLIILRNMLYENHDKFEDAAILFIFNEEIDSILGGAKDLLDEGQPLYYGSIYENLVEDMNDSSLKKHEEEILKFHMDNISVNNQGKGFIWDLEEVLSFIQKGGIEDVEYHIFDIFPDKDLSGFSSEDMNKRLIDNNKIYETVESIKKNRNSNEEIADKFDADGAEKLSGTDWKLCNYGDLKKSLENKNNYDPLVYLGLDENTLDDRLKLWEKPGSNTKAGQRKRHIVVFNESGIEDYTLEFKFNQYLEKTYISPTSKDVANTRSGKRLYLNIEEADEQKFVSAIYRHNGKTHSTYKFYVANLPISEETLEDIKTDYRIKATSGKEYIELEDKYDGFKIPEEYSVFCEDDGVEIIEESDTSLIDFNKDTWESDEFRFDLTIDDHPISFLVKDEDKKIVPKPSKWIWKKKREERSHFDFEEGKVRFKNQEFSLYSEFKRYLQYEEDIIDKKIIYGSIINQTIYHKNLELALEVKKKFLKIIDYYKENELLPSLTYMDERLKELVIDFIEIFNKKINEIDEGTILRDYEKNLFKIGLIESNNNILFTPLHPLNLIYQIKVNDYLDGEIISSKILNQLNPMNLLPYIVEEDRKMKPVYQNDAKEWIIYEDIKNLKNENYHDYIAFIIDEKIDQFFKHFEYIFKGKVRPTLKINIINVENDLNILVGIIKNLLNQLEAENINKVPKFEVKFYDKNNKSSFDKLFSLNTVEEIEKFLGLKLDVKTYSKYDIILNIRKSIKYYFVKKNDFQYAHISFYEFKEENNFANYGMKNLESGLSMGGLKASIKSRFEDDDYRMGFGLKNYNYKNNSLVETAKNLNELTRNLENQAKDPYHKNESLVSIYSLEKEDKIKRALDESMWVTFINPIVDIDFFQNIDNKTIVLHYSDQYTDFDRLDAITITNKSKQYKDIIGSFLDDFEGVEYNEETLDDIINIFNSINGDWLLNILRKNNNYKRSKLSEIVAIKYMLAFLEEEHILWVPISLEEILRIAGIAGIKKKDGLFSAKNLNVKGEMSDDLLFLGIDTYEDTLKLYIHPVEVKVGTNKINKGKTQVDKIYDVFRENLSFEKDSGRKIFINQFYRNFFMQLFVSNVKKMVRLDIFDEKKLEVLNDVKNRLANDDFMISDALESLIGKGTVISFEKQLTFSSCNLEKDMNILRFSEKHVYTGLSFHTEVIRKRFIEDVYDIKSEAILSNKLVRTPSLDEETKPKIDTGENEEDNERSGIIGKEVESKKSINDEDKDNENKPNKRSAFMNLSDTRICLGTVKGSKKKIYWEYGHPKLPNRHLLISGKSGQGKTYLIETILYELTKNNIPSLVIDYTDGFKEAQLEKHFKSKVGNRLKQYYLIKDKIGINPFKRNDIVLDEDTTIKEEPFDVAERIKTVISAIYPRMGIQQLTSIYKAVQNGIEEYGDKMDFDILRKNLEEQDSSYSSTALSQLNSFFNKHPFKFDKDFSWEKIDQNDGNISIIQLMGFPQDIQLLISEFLLWDLWYYKKQHGSEADPLTLVIDEAQNLDHSSKSPTAKILTEGRKFGFSGIFSTQFLQGQLSKDEISRLQMASQKIYFKPPDNEMNSIASDFDDKNRWKQELKKLVKGRCINKGHILDEEKGNLLGVQSIVLNIDSFKER
ncbi:MAG: DNA phosphorothioation-dependent restriction protein DptH [Bacillota bacterium]